MKAFIQIVVCLTLFVSVSFSQNKTISELDFVPNLGQITDFDNKSRTDVLFSSDVLGVNIFLRKNGISYLQNDFGEIDNEIRKKVKTLENNNSPGELEYANKLREAAEISFHQIDVDFLGSNSEVKVLKKKKTNDYLNFYNAANPNGITHVSLYNLIQYENLYKGIGIDFYGNEKGCLVLK
jgi:hypothetical protein